MKIVAISDTHTQHNRVKIPPCDVLIHAGDFSYTGTYVQVTSFLEWLVRQPAEHILFIAGNHDLSFYDNPEMVQDLLQKYIIDRGYGERVFYLEDQSKVINGVHFYGSPWQPEFCNWAFNYKRNSAQAMAICNQIPKETQVLITHGPPKNILDKCMRRHVHYPQNAGCEILRNKISDELNKLQYHIFGHIHEGYGMDEYTIPGKTFINASTCNLTYSPVNKPVVIEI